MDEPAEPPRVHPVIDATAEHDLLCPACGKSTLTVVTVRTETSKGPRAAGGWAYCLNSACEATPHPAMEVSRG